MPNTFVIAIAFIAALLWPAQPSDVLPSAARRAIDERFADWRVAPTSDRIAARFKHTPMSPLLNLLSGDFDGNGETDYALLIQYASAGQGPRSQLVALLQRRGEFYLATLGSPFEADPNRYLWPRARGETLWDVDLGKQFTCEFDAIGLHYDCCGCRTFLFRAWQFHSVSTCD